ADQWNNAFAAKVDSPLPIAALAAPGILSARVSTAVNTAPFSDDPLLTGPQWPIETFAPRGTPVDGRTDWTSYFAAAVASGEIIKLDKAGYVVSSLAVGGAGVLTRFIGNGNSLILSGGSGSGALVTATGLGGGIISDGVNWNTASLGAGVRG